MVWFLIFIAIIIFVTWKASKEVHGRCECPDCDNCPFPRCEESDR